MSKNGSMPDEFEWPANADSTQARLAVLAERHQQSEARVDKLEAHFTPGDPDGIVLRIDKKVDRIMTAVWLLVGGVPLIGAVIGGILWLIHNAK